MAIMGASGAGKTTLLNTLAFRNAPKLKCSGYFSSPFEIHFIKAFTSIYYYLHKTYISARNNEYLSCECTISPGNNNVYPAIHVSETFTFKVI